MKPGHNFPCDDPKCPNCEQLHTTESLRALATKLPAFVRRPIEQAIERAVHPKGMSVHDGKIHDLASDKVAYLLRAYDRLAAADALPLLEGLTRRKYPESTGLEAQIDAVLPDPMTLRHALAFAKGWIKATDSDGDTDRVIAKIEASLAGAPTAEQADELVLSLVSAHADWLKAFWGARKDGVKQPELGNLPEQAKYDAAYEKVLTALGVRAQSPAEPLIERQQRRLHEAMDALEWLNESGYRLAEDDRETLSGLIAQQEKQ